MEETEHVIQVSKSGIFSLTKFLMLWEKHDPMLPYTVFDALRNRFDD